MVRRVHMLYTISLTQFNRAYLPNIVLSSRYLSSYISRYFTVPQAAIARRHPCPIISTMPHIFVWLQAFLKFRHIRRHSRKLCMEMV